MVTEKQKFVLSGLTDKPLRTASLAIELNMRTSEYWSYDRIHNILRRLEDRGSVRRETEYGISKWELTSKGRMELNRG